MKTNHTKDEHSEVTTPEPKTDEVEGIVEEFKKQWKCEHPNCGGGGICQRDRITEIIRRTLQTQAEKAKREREELLKEIITVAELMPYAEEHNGELVDCSYYQIYAGQIKAIATRHNINLE